MKAVVVRRYSVEAVANKTYVRETELLFKSNTVVSATLTYVAPRRLVKFQAVFLDTGDRY